MRTSRAFRLAAAGARRRDIARMIAGGGGAKQIGRNQYMPTLPKRLCIEPNCSRPVIPGSCRCAEHTANAARRRDPARQERASLYKTKRWESIRRGVLERQGLCVICLREGRYTPATVVDHIAPHRGDQRGQDRFQCAQIRQPVVFRPGYRSVPVLSVC